MKATNNILYRVAPLLMVLIVGCATNTPLPNPDLLTFCEDGRTRREEILLRLGPPSRTMENERILFYRVGQNRKGYFIREPSHDHWAKVRHSLVLVLDDAGVLQKHSLVTVH